MIVRDEQFYHKKHPLIQQFYFGRPLPNGDKYEMDVRHIVWSDDYALKRILVEKIGLSIPVKNGEFDIALHKIQQWVVRILTYTSDSELGFPEYWLYPVETLGMMRADCEDGMALIASLATNAGVAPWRLRCCAGWVKLGANAEAGGHGWLDYIRESDNLAVPVDWCYYQDSDTPVAEKVPTSQRPEYFNGDKIWFSFNHLYAWSHRTATLIGKVKKQVQKNDT